MDKSRPLDKDAYIVSPCDAIINSFKRKIRYKTDFMRVKGDIYSLKDILKNVDKSLIKKFVGGTIVQGYLSAETYHRYHSPVEGVLVDAFVIDGSYFLVNNFYKSNLNRFCGQNQVKNSQEFLANVQTRGVFIFKTDEIGYVVFIAIGMTEVSSCIIYDKLIGKRIHRGEEIGHFQYGGSSYLMIFERKHQDKLEFTFNTSKMTKIRSSMALLKSG
jgi:phosphatidylserine decarboxylase